MNYADNYIPLAVVFTVFAIESINGFQIGLDPVVKSFIAVVLILGPLSIFSLIFLLKKIEQNDPGRIRWK
tara:strand:- start:5010 stop:5219 length:210 start_codon:yes stop_codon:yes gene_type:complete